MFSKKTNAVVMLALIVASSAAMANGGACKASQEKAKKVYGNATQEACRNVTSTPNLDKNPYIYKNPDATCDLGLSLPGLPSFGSGGNFDACAIVKAVTGPMVREVNRAMQEEVDQAIAVAGKEKIDAAVNAANSGSIAEFGNKQYEEIGSPTDINNMDGLGDRVKEQYKN